MPTMMRYKKNNMSSSLITAAPGTSDSQLPKCLQLSPVKVISSPTNASMLQLEAWPRLPNICPWCLVWYKSTLATHMTSKHHREHPFFTRTLALKNNPNEDIWKTEVRRLNLQGRLRNNIRALNLKDRPIVPARRVDEDHVEMHTEKMVLCQLCKQALSRKAFRETHLKSCPGAQKLKITKTVTKEMAQKAEPLLEPEDVTMQRLLQGKDKAFSELLFDLKKDRLAITLFALRDEVAEAFLIRLAKNGQGKHAWVAQARQRLRLPFYILDYFKVRFGEKCKTLKDVMLYKNWHLKENGTTALVDCCNKICGYDTGTKKYLRVNDVMTFSSVMQECSDVKQNDLHYEKLEDREESQKEGAYLKQYLTSDSWKLYTVRIAARQKALKINFKSILVSPHDFKVYLTLVEEIAMEESKKLMAAYKGRDRATCFTAHHKFIEAMPIAIGAYSTRRVSEPFHLTISEFEQRADLDQLSKDYDRQMSPMMREEVQSVMLLEQKGKGNLPLLTLIKSHFEEVIQTVCSIDYRKFMRIPDANQYVFASIRSRSALGYADPCRCQARFAKECEGQVKNPDLLRTRHFRMSVSTGLGELDLTYQFKKELCSVLGHSLPVHERSYNMPQALRVAAHMSFAMRSFVEDKLHTMKDKTLESQMNQAVDIQPGDPDM